MASIKFDIRGRIFTAAVVVSLGAAFIFLILDLFFFEDFYSAIVELGSILILSGFFVLSLKKGLKNRLVVPFVVFVFIALDFGWLLGGGLNLSISLLMLLAMLASLVMLKQSQRRWFIIAWMVNLVLLAITEYLNPEIREINTDVYQVLISSHIVIALTFSVGLLMMTLFLNFFDRAQSIISNQNDLLKKRTTEMAEQNEVLKSQQEEIVKQQAVIDQKNQQLIAQTENKFEQLFHSTPNVISINRLSDGVYLDVNDSYADLVGYTKEDLVGSTAKDLGVFDSDKSEQSILATLKGEGEISYNEIALISKSGKVKKVLYSAKIIVIDDVQCVLFIGDDITARINTEAELQKSVDQIESYARMNSHDVRAPLTRLMGLVELMKGSKDEGEQNLIREEIVNSAAELDRIIHEINEILETSQKG